MALLMTCVSLIRLSFSITMSWHPNKLFCWSTDSCSSTFRTSLLFSARLNSVYFSSHLVQSFTREFITFPVFFWKKLTLKFTEKNHVVLNYNSITLQNVSNVTAICRKFHAYLQRNDIHKLTWRTLLQWDSK